MKTKLIVACLICLGLVLPACGKKGAPIPQDQKNRFAWKTEDAQFIGNGCLAVTASMTGAVHNVDSFLLELEPLTPQTDPDLPPELAVASDTCAGCPFTPRESSEIVPQERAAGDKATRYTFTYCPSVKAAAYRWRLVARNVFKAFPFELTPIRTVEQQRPLP